MPGRALHPTLELTDAFKVALGEPPARAGLRLRAEDDLAARLKVGRRCLRGVRAEWVPGETYRQASRR